MCEFTAAVFVLVTTLVPILIFIYLSAESVVISAATACPPCFPTVTIGLFINGYSI